MTTTIDAEAVNSPRDAERTRKVILMGARAEFAEHGLSGARVDRIAERCGCNKRLLYYYFGDKDALFRAVLAAAYAQIRERERQLQLEAVSPVQAIEQLVHFTWDYYIDNPEFLSLLNTANLHKARHLDDSAEIRDVNHPLVELIDGVVQRGQSSGVFRADIDPVQLYVSIAGLAYFYLSNNHTLAAIFGRNLKAVDALAQRRSHITDVVLSYVTKG